MIVNILGFSLYDFDIAITDLVIFIFSIFFIYKIKVLKIDKYLKSIFINLFTAIGSASFFGTIFHLFFPLKVGTFLGLIVWNIVAVSIAISSLFILSTSLYLYNKKKIPVFYILLISLITVTWITLVSTKFLPLLILYTVASLLLFYVSIKKYLKGNLQFKYLMLGILFTLLSGFVQSQKIDLIEKLITYNSFYHMLQLTGLYFLYIFLKKYN